ncbi:unnamed protein product [Leptidea sinapis]|uniref:Uncharacterized protein n=1 Tax=Leptidea sinapis TaxID=189913 RepID=A0A5E4QD28_9NEOP|nr:unnamed protein product [Leptidea sinapis]
MNRDFVYDLQEQRSSAWSRAGSTIGKWLWGAFCCGVPGIPCYFCTCCEKLDDVQRDRPRINQSTATAERISRPHRPHAPRSRKSTPEMLSAVRYALSQLQGEPAPPIPITDSKSHTPEPG